MSAYNYYALSLKASNASRPEQSIVFVSFTLAKHFIPFTMLGFTAK